MLQTAGNKRKMPAHLGTCSYFWIYEKGHLWSMKKKYIKGRQQDLLLGALWTGNQEFSWLTEGTCCTFTQPLKTPPSQLHCCDVSTAKGTHSGLGGWRRLSCNLLDKGTISWFTQMPLVTKMFSGMEPTRNMWLSTGIAITTRFKSDIVSFLLPLLQFIFQRLWRLDIICEMCIIFITFQENLRTSQKQMWISEKGSSCNFIF